jgi:hypothetical protein
MKSDETIDIRQVSEGTQADGHVDSPRSELVTDGVQRPHDSAPETADSSDSHRSSSTLKRWVKITLFQLPVDGRVRICLREDQTSTWAVGDPDADLVGIALETPSRNTILKLNNFILNKHELIFSSYAACDEIRLSIWVQCTSNAIRGHVDLPLGASVTFQSEVDRTSLVGLSSFSLSVSE